MRVSHAQFIAEGSLRHHKKGNNTPLFEVVQLEWVQVKSFNEDPLQRKSAEDSGANCRSNTVDCKISTTVRHALFIAVMMRRNNNAGLLELPQLKWAQVKSVDKDPSEVKKTWHPQFGLQTHDKKGLLEVLQFETSLTSHTAENHTNVANVMSILTSWLIPQYTWEHTVRLNLATLHTVAKVLTSHGSYKGM